MSTYTTVGGDSLPLIAEACGHPGEWQAILYFNEASLADYNNLSPGTEVILPDGWGIGGDVPPPPPRTTSTTRSTSSSSSSGA